MREPLPGIGPFGVMAEFDRPERLMAAIRQARAAGFRRLDAYFPFPIEGADEALGFEEHRIQWLTLAGGIVGATLGYGLQVYTNLDYPIEIGARPLVATPAFLLIAFELMVLFAVLFAVGGMLALNRLPRLHHPVFDVPAFQLASADRFFLVVFGDDEKFAAARDFLARLQPIRIDLVPHTEEPE